MTTALNYPLIDGIFQGIVFFMTALAFIEYFSSQKKAFLYYALYLLVSSFFFIYAKGIYQYFLPEKHYIDGQRLFILLYVSHVIYAIFLKLILGIKPYYHKIQNIIKYFILFTFIEIIALSVIGYKEPIKGIVASHYFDIINTIFVLLILPTLYKNAAHTGKLIAVGTTFMVLGGFIAAVLSFDINSVQYVEIFQLGFIIEMIFFALALNSEYKWVNKKKYSLVNRES